MSMIKEYASVPADQLGSWIANPDWYDELCEAPGVVCFGLDKAWHGLHFLMTGTAWDASPPLGLAILGGTEFGDDIGYGPPLYLTPDQVRTVSVALNSLNPSGLRDRYSPEKMGEIYPQVWDNPDEVMWLEESFVVLREFYAGAAIRGDAVIHYIT